MTKSNLNLLGKDYFTVEEAAHYCCVKSLSHFREQARHYGLLPIRWMGKIVYRKSDLQGAIEAEWQHYTELLNIDVALAGISTRDQFTNEYRSVRSRSRKPN